MVGWKKIGRVDICSAPCCPGYREVVEKPPFLQSVAYCVEDLSAWNVWKMDRLVKLRNYINSDWPTPADL